MSQQFKNLGDIVGDFLILIEVNKAEIIKNPVLNSAIQILINKCAEN